jgi:hypothetical protein
VTEYTYGWFRLKGELFLAFCCFEQDGILFTFDSSGSNVLRLVECYLNVECPTNELETALVQKSVITLSIGLAQTKSCNVLFLLTDPFLLQINSVFLILRTVYRNQFKKLFLIANTSIEPTLD